MPKCTPKIDGLIKIIWENFLLPSHLFEMGEPFCTPLRREKVSKTKNPSDLLNRKGKYSLSFVLNFNRQKEKDTAYEFFSVSCVLIF